MKRQDLPRAEVSPFVRACALEGEAELLSGCVVSACLTRPLVSRKRGDTHAFMAVFAAGSHGERQAIVERCVLEYVQHHALPAWPCAKPLAMADHALACDYADQSHMARECRAQTGRTPAQLARGVPIAEADWIYRLEFADDEDSPPSRSA